MLPEHTPRFRCFRTPENLVASSERGTILYVRSSSVAPTVSLLSNRKDDRKRFTDQGAQTKEFKATGLAEGKCNSDAKGVINSGILRVNSNSIDTVMLFGTGEQEYI